MPVQPRIHLLSDHVANKIAAGEVVDRPASVLKELMENALDAGATQIDVSIGGGGKRFMRVQDNGCGMDRDNALLCVERHATSKIREVDDIESVSTLGFRGEALAAIASVSRFTLTTRPDDQLEGTALHIVGGKIMDVKEAGCPPGTSFEVRNLFFNVPARRKFLRTEQTELTHIRQTFLIYALSHADVGMTLTVDDRPAYTLAAGAALPDRLSELFGRDLLASLCGIQPQPGEVLLRGFVGRPHAHRSDRSEQFIFVNGRPASAPLVGFALNEAYHTLLPKGRYPSIFLFIDLPPEWVDVNVHPTKKEVRFRHPDAVRDAIITALRGALTQPSPQGEPAPMPTSMGMRPDVPRLKIEDLPMMPMFNYPKIEPVIEGEPLPARPPYAQPLGAMEPSPGGGPWSWCRVLGQVGGLYVVMETEDGLVLMDPHAAHERLLFERFMQEAVSRKVRSQGLLAPETIELTPFDAALVRKQLPLLEAMGFGISDFGGDSFILDALPVCLGSVSGQSVLVAVAESLEQSGERGGTPHWAEQKVARAACRAAVKARDQLTVQEIERLVIDLAGAEMPYTCPHGRPTLIFMGFKELDKKFGRT